MPSKAEKILERMRRSKAGWKVSDFETLYLGFGFVISHGRSHMIIKHPDFPQLRDTLPRHNEELDKPYAVYAVRLIDRLKELQREGESDDE